MLKMTQLEGLTKIGLGTFSHQQNLKFLNLSHNNLVTINFNLFSRGFKQLTELHLNDNHLKEIIGWEHSDLPNIQLLTIFNNDFNCSYLEKTLRHFPQNVSLKTNSSRILLHTDNGSNLHGIRCIDKDHESTEKSNKFENLKNRKIEQIETTTQYSRL